MNKIKIYTKNSIKKHFTIHLSNSRRNVLLFSTPRSGSTWLMEVIGNQQNIKVINEPLNLRNEQVRCQLSFDAWDKLIEIDNIEIIASYLQQLISGKISFKNPPPFSRYYKPFVNHSILKIIHGAETFMFELSDKLNANVLFLIRHPIPTSLSRKQLPRIDYFLKSNYYRSFFNKEQIYYFSNIIDSGSFFEKSIVDWCLQNYFPLKINRPQIIISYENLVLNPDNVLNELALHGIIIDKEKSMSKLVKPSKSTYQSSNERKMILAENKHVNKSKELVSSWVNKVDNTMVLKTQEILDYFEIDFYISSSPDPNYSFRKEYES